MQRNVLDGYELNLQERLTPQSASSQFQPSSPEGIFLFGSASADVRHANYMLPVGRDTQFCSNRSCLPAAT